MSSPDGADDFASAAMMRIVAAGLKRQGIAIASPPPNGAHVPRLNKRDVLEAILSEHGPLAILSISDAAPHMPPEPVAQALTLARDTEDLLDRWRRLERFSHARHTVETERLDIGGVRLTHRARDGDLAPSHAESLLVLGLIAVLAEMIEPNEVTLSTVTGELWRCQGAWCATAGVPAPGGLVLSTSAGETSMRRPCFGAANDPVDDLRTRLVADPLRRWTISELAAETGASARTLQRRLTRRSVTFSRLVSEARLQVAASHLCKADGPGLAEIGFLAGFSDQAHFTRSFSRAVGTTPRAYRRDFGR